MSRTHPGRHRVPRRVALIAALLAAALLATETEAISHRHGGVWGTDTSPSIVASPEPASAEWPCSICRVADAASTAAPAPAGVASLPRLSGDSVARGIFPILAGATPVPASRAPPGSSPR